MCLRISLHFLRSGWASGSREDRRERLALLKERARFFSVNWRSGWLRHEVVLGPEVAEAGATEESGEEAPEPHEPELEGGAAGGSGDAVGGRVGSHGGSPSMVEVRRSRKAALDLTEPSPERRRGGFQEAARREQRRIVRVQRSARAWRAGREKGTPASVISVTAQIVSE